MQIITVYNMSWGNASHIMRQDDALAAGVVSCPTDRELSCAFGKTETCPYKVGYTEDNGAADLPACPVHRALAAGKTTSAKIAHAADRKAKAAFCL